MVALLWSGVLIGVSEGAASNQFRFVMLSDVHVSPTILPNHLSKYPLIVGEITNMAPRPAAVFVTGDLTEYSLATDYDAFITNVIVPVTNAGIPIYLLPGNHEINGNTLDMWREKLGVPVYQSVDIQQTHFILSCGVPEGIYGDYALKSSPSMTWGIGQAGQIDTNQLAWIQADLASPASTQAQFTIFMAHFPVWNESGDGYEIQNNDWWGNITGAGTSMRQWCDVYGIDAVFYGHRHVQRVPSIHTYSSGGKTLAVLNESTVYGKQESYTNAQGVAKTGGVYGYDVYDISGKSLSHYRKTIDDYGGQFIGPRNVFTFSASREVLIANQAASGISTSSATLNGILLSCGTNESADVTLYWGSDNQGTNAVAWSNSISLGWRGDGVFSTNVTGLQNNHTYYFHSFASNDSGMAWAPEATSFTTVAPGGAAPGASATVLYWDPANLATNGFGGSGSWNSPTGWYNGSNWVAWVQNKTNDAIFKGVAGTVALSNANLSVGLFQVDTPGYLFDVKDFAGNTRTLSVANFVGSENMCFTNTVAVNNQILAFQVISSRATYKGDLANPFGGSTGRIIYKLTGGTLEMARVSPYHSEVNNPWYQFYIDSGTLLWNTAYIPSRRLNCGSSGLVGNQSVLGGNGANVIANFDNNATYWQINPGGALAPGDPAVNGGIGTLTLSQLLWFDLGPSANTASVFRIQFAGATDYDKVVMIGTNSYANSPVNFAHPLNANAVGTRFEPVFSASFSGGSTGDFLCVIDNRVVIKAASAGINTIGGTMANATNNGTLLFTNAASTIYTFQYKYNVDKATPTLDGSGNDFGLLIIDIQGAGPSSNAITATAGVHGVISPSGTVSVAVGADQGFSISADPYYHIEDVLIDGGSIGPAASYTFTEVAAAHSIAASFDANLAGNGTPEWWFAQYHWTNNFDAAETNDADEDGMQNWAEFLAGTDPTNKESRLAFEALVQESGSTGAVVRWQGVVGKFYRLERGTNLMDNQLFNTIIRSNIPGAWPQNIETDRTDSVLGPRFYRVQLE